MKNLMYKTPDLTLGVMLDLAYDITGTQPTAA